MALDLRPLTLAELLDRSFSTYKRHLWLFVGIMAVPASLAVVYSAIMQVLQFALGIQQQPDPDAKPEQILITMVPVFISAILFLIVYMVIYAFALGATTIAVAHLYKDRTVSVGEAYREVRRHGWRLILLLLWASLRVGGAWIGLIFVGAVIGGVLTVFVPILGGIFMALVFLCAFIVAGYLSVRNNAGASRVVVDGETTSGGGAIYLYNAAGSGTISLVADSSGEGRIVTQVLQITGGSDLSEQFDIKPIQDELKAGMIVSIDPENPGRLLTSTRAYDRTVAGVVSGAGGVKPGMMMGQHGTAADGKHPVALTGRVYCWVDASHGAIQPGDMITTSDTPGHGMKVTDHSLAQGAIIGKAMSSLASGRGLVLVLVSLQ